MNISLKEAGKGTYKREDGFALAAAFIAGTFQALCRECDPNNVMALVSEPFQTFNIALSYVLHSILVLDDVFLFVLLQENRMTLKRHKNNYLNKI